MGGISICCEQKKCKFTLWWFIAFFRTYFVDVTYQVSSKETSDRYYFYERYVPYYSIFETPDNNVIARRKAIYINSMDIEN